MLRSGWSESLDDLARALATPMPRRRALGVLGVTVVGLATGGTAGASRPLGKQQSSGCGNGYKVCSPETKACRATCCPVHTDCSLGPKAASNGCPISDGCCDPCNRERSQPDGNGGCRPGPIPDHCPCSRGQKKCDAGAGRPPTCCDEDEYCVTNKKVEGSGSSSFGTCCKKGQGFCMRGSPARPFCCPRGTRCCTAGAGGGTGGLVAASCCSRLTKICERGVCRCKPGHDVGCGKDCCHPRLHKCCGTVRKRCVPKGTDCADALPDT